MEAYRSGHNGPDSKSGDGKPSVGSNPTASVEKKSRESGFSFCILLSSPFTLLSSQTILLRDFFSEKRKVKREKKRLLCKPQIPYVKNAHTRSCAIQIPESVLCFF